MREQLRGGERDLDAALVTRAELAATALMYTPRDFQVRAVASVLGGDPTMLIWPAGGGKGRTIKMLAACAPACSSSETA